MFKNISMLNKIIPTGLAAAVFAAGLSLAAPTVAQAGGKLSLTINGEHGSITIGDRRHRNGHNGRNYGGHHNHNNHQYVSVCKPRKALRKARKIGVRHAHVDRVGSRFVIVKGRKRGSTVKIAFERRSRRCNVAWVDRTPVYYGRQNGYGHGYGHGYSGNHGRRNHY